MSVLQARPTKFANRSRLFDLLLLKMSGLHNLLQNQLEDLELPIADKIVLRGGLANAETYRQMTGQVGFFAGNVVPATDSANHTDNFYASLSATGKKFFRFVEAGW